MTEPGHKPVDPVRLTILETTEGKRLTKRFSPEGVDQYDKGTWFRARVVELAGFAELSALLSELERQPGQMVVMGVPAPGYETAPRMRRLAKAKPDQPATLTDAGSRVLHFDLDELPLPEGLGWHDPERAARWAWDFLGNRLHALRNVQVHWQASSSAATAGKERLAKFHFWTLTDAAIDADRRKAVFLAAGSDAALAGIAQANYTANPIFERVTDPFEGRARSGVIAGGRELVPVSELPLPKRQPERQSKPAGKPYSAPEMPVGGLPGVTSPYGWEALQRARAAILAADARNVTINRQAYWIGGLVAGGEIALADAEAALLEAGQDSGHARYAEAVENGLRDGLLRPVQRDPGGRFTGAGATEAEAVPLPDFMEPEKARELIRQAIRAFLVKAAAWWATDEALRGPVPVLVVAASPGTGKSRIAREELERFDLTALGGDAVFYAPTLGLADEAAGHAAELGAGSHVTRGRSGVSPETGDPMCARSELAEQGAKLGLRVAPSFCKRVPEGGGEAILCPFHASCAHVRQWETLPPVNVLRFEATSYATLPGDGSGRKTGLHVIDETLWPQLIATADIPLDQWTRPRRARRAATLAKEADAVAMAADTTAAAARVLSALQAGKSPLGIGFSAGDFRQFADAERGPDVLANAPNAPDDRLAEELSDLAKVNPDAGKRAAVWRVLAEAAERGLEATDRVRIVRNVRPQGGGEPRDVLRVSWSKEPPRDAPVILLDADAAPEIVERLYPSAEIVRAELRPRADVVQVSDVTLSLNALGAGKVQEADPIKGAENRAKVAALVRAEVYRDRLTGGRGVLVIASRKVVLRMFADAGHNFHNMSKEAVSDFMLETPLHGARWLWFGPRALGRNDWQHFGTAIVIGREELPLDALQDQARALFGDSGEPLELIPECGAIGPDGEVTLRAEMPLSRVSYCMADGSGAAVEVRMHPDPRVRALQRQKRELAARQGFERLRLATAKEPKRVVIACKVPIPGLPVTRLVRFAELVPDRARQAMAEAAARGGVLRISAAGLAEDAPETFPTVKAADQWLSREGRRAFNTPMPVIEDTISGAGVLTPIRVRVRLPGQRGPHATPALVVLPGDPRAMAEAQLGPLAGFELVDPVPIQEPRADNRPEPRARIGQATPAPVVELADERLWRDAKRRMLEAAATREAARSATLSRDPPRPVSGVTALETRPDPPPARRLVFAPRVVPLPELVAALGEPQTVWRETPKGWVPGWTRDMAVAAAWVFARYRAMTPQFPEAWA